MKKALIIVDVQNDFVEGGALAVQGGKKVATNLAAAIAKGYLDGFDYVVTTQDWHMAPGRHWSENPDYLESWPKHCEAATEGAALVDELQEALKASGRTITTVHKGEFEDAYSGFLGHTLEGESLHPFLLGKGVDSLTIIGLATDYCVRQTAIDAVWLAAIANEIDEAQDSNPR